MTAAEKRLTLTLLCVSGSIIYWLPFFSEIYYVPMQDAFGFTKTQLGILSSTFGFVSLIAYFPGGWLADRVSSRKLITLALVVTAAGGFVFSTLPSFEICLLIYGLWGISTACIFWSAMIKATRDCAPPEEQGRVFGVLEGGRNFTDMVTGTVVLAVFALRGGNDEALAGQIFFYSLAALVLALFVWITMKDNKPTQGEATSKQPRAGLANIIAVLKFPMVWLMAIIILTAYSGYWGAAYFTPYATEVFALGSVLGGAVGTAKLWIAALAAVVAGVIADRIGPAKAVLGSFVLMTAGFFIFALLPGAPNLLALLLINGAIISCAVYALRGIYFALLEQGGVPSAVTGTAAGLVSVVGYTPDIFMPILGGVILDANPGAQGYQNFFLFVAILSLIGLAASYAVYRRTQGVLAAVPEN
jgi:MFS transporter, GlpU family, inner membrane protein